MRATARRSSKAATLTASRQRLSHRRHRLDAQPPRADARRRRRELRRQHVPARRERLDLPLPQRRLLGARAVRALGRGDRLEQRARAAVRSAVGRDAQPELAGRRARDRRHEPSAVAQREHARAAREAARDRERRAAVGRQRVGVAGGGRRERDDAGRSQVLEVAAPRRRRRCCCRGRTAASGGGQLLDAVRRDAQHDRPPACAVPRERAKVVRRAVCVRVGKRWAVRWAVRSAAHSLSDDTGPGSAPALFASLCPLPCLTPPAAFVTPLTLSASLPCRPHPMMRSATAQRATPAAAAIAW